MARPISASHDLRRDEILNVAAACFAQRSYPATSMNDIAAACGTSKARLYHYYESKEAILFDLLDAPANVGLTLTENFAMWPTAAVSGFYFGHPESQYFGVARIGRDQLEDYARRRGVDLATAERWLRPNLD